MILDLFELDGRVALVTGANKGLGQGIAVALAQAGAHVAGVSRGPSDATREAVEATGRRYLHLSADLVSTEAIPGIVDAVVEEFGHIDVLVNNAGTIARHDALDFPEQDWDRVMGVNLRSLFFLSQAVARRFVAQGGGGRIINIASMLSFQGGIRVASYTASKGGVRQLTMLLANEWAPHGICVNAIAPGYMATDNTAALQADPQRNAAILARIPAGRWGTPQDLAGAAVFLASPASAYVNGFTLAVDGGWLAR